MQQPNIVRIWKNFEVDEDDDEVNIKYFSSSENRKINEAFVRKESKVLDLDDKTVDFSSNEVLFKTSGIKAKIRSLEKLIPHLFTYISITDENKRKVLKHPVFESIYMSKFRDFYYASLFGVLRAGEIERTPLELSLFGSITKDKIFKNLNFDVYLQITFDYKYEDSGYYFEYLSFLNEGNEGFSKQIGFKQTKLLSRCRKLMSVYRKNLHLFSDERPKNPIFVQLTDPFFWIMNKILSEFPDICYDKPVFLGTNLSEAQCNEMQQLFTSKDPIIVISSNIVCWSKRDIAENFENTIFEFIFDDIQCGFQLNGEEILIPQGNYFQIINFDVIQEKNIIRLKALNASGFLHANKFDIDMVKLQDENEEEMARINKEIEEMEINEKLINKKKAEEEEKKNEMQVIPKENIETFIALQRIGKDLEDVTNFAYFPLNPERTHLKFVIPGRGLYEKGLFQLDFKIPLKYPHEPPQVKFDTKIIHPNVDAKTGEINLIGLNEFWTPVMTIQNLLYNIQNLLYIDEIDSEDLKEALTNDAKKCVELYANKSDILNEMKQNGIYGLMAHRKLIEHGELFNIE